MKTADKMFFCFSAFLPWLLVCFLHFAFIGDYDTAIATNMPILQYDPWRTAIFMTGALWLLLSPFITLLLIREARLADK